MMMESQHRKIEEKFSFRGSGSLPKKKVHSQHLHKKEQQSARSRVFVCVCVCVCVCDF